MHCFNIVAGIEPYVDDLFNIQFLYFFSYDISECLFKMKTSWNNFWKSFCVFFKLIWLSNLSISTWLLSKVFRLRVLGLLIQIIIHYISSSTTIEFFSTKDFTPLSLKKDLTLFENTLLSDTFLFVFPKRLRQRLR